MICKECYIYNMIFLYLISSGGFALKHMKPRIIIKSFQLHYIRPEMTRSSLKMTVLTVISRPDCNHQILGRSLSFEAPIKLFVVRMIRAETARHIQADQLLYEAQNRKAVGLSDQPMNKSRHHHHVDSRGSIGIRSKKVF